MAKRVLSYKFLKLLHRIGHLLSTSIMRLLRGQPVGNLPLSNSTVEFADVRIATRMITRPHQNNEGPYIKQYEELFANYLGVKHAYSFLGGRVSLSAILEALEFGEGDEIIVPAYNCVVVPNALYYRGIKPLYADIDLNTFNILPEEIDKLVTSRTRGVIIQHIFGIIADLDPILSVADRHGLIVIEDCAHALGAEYNGKKVSRFGKAAFFSTEQSKVISTQMGGMAVTNDDLIGKRIRSIQEKSSFPSAEEIRLRLWQFISNYAHSRPYCNEFWGPLFKEIIGPLVGAKKIVSTTESEICSIRPHDYGKRLPNALAVLGLRQLKNIERYNDRRLETAMTYAQLLKSMGAKTVPIIKNTKPVFLRYPVYVKDKERFIEIAHYMGIEPGVWFTDVIHPAGTNWQKLGYKKGQCPNAEIAVKNVVNLPTGHRLSNKVINNFSAIKGVVVPEGDFLQLNDNRPGKKLIHA